MSTITIARQYVKVEGVSDVQVSEIVEDGEEFVRAIRIYAPDGENDVLIYEVQIKGETQDAIKVTAPEQEF